MITEPLTDERTPRVLAQIFSWLDSAGYVTAFAPARQSYETAGVQHAKAISAAADRKAVLATVSSQVLHDGLDAGLGAVEVATAQQNADGVAEIARSAARLGYSEALAAISGPSIVVDHLQPFVESKAATAAELAVIIPRHVVDPDSASGAGPEVAATWSALDAIRRDLEGAWAILDLVTATSIVEYLAPLNDLGASELRFREPWNGLQPAVFQRYGTPITHPTVRLIEALEHHRQPTALTLSDALALRLSRDGLRTVHHHRRHFEGVTADGKSVVGD